MMLAFMATANSFHRMTDEEHALANPLRLKNHQIHSENEFQCTRQTISSGKPSGRNKLRLLNGLYPQGKANSKSLLKDHSLAGFLC